LKIRQGEDYRMKKVYFRVKLNDFLDMSHAVL